VHTSPATVAAILLLVAASFLIAIAAIAVRPHPPGPVVSTHAAPGTQPRAQERDHSARRTPRRGAGRRTARPAARSTPEPAADPVLPPEQAAAPQQEAAVTPPPQPPENVVTTYYRALDAGRFDAAWTLLTPAVRAGFGPYGQWRDGYATTLSNTPRDIEVAHEGAVATIAHELVTEDRSPCGPVERTFDVSWRLTLTDGGWRVASLSAVKRAGAEPADACADGQNAARATGGTQAD